MILKKQFAAMQKELRETLKFVKTFKEFVTPVLDDVIEQAGATVYFSPAKMIIIAPSNMSQKVFREFLRNIGDALDDHNYRLSLVWESLGMNVSFRFDNKPIEVWVTYAAEHFPVDELSPGCKLEKSLVESYRMVCPAKNQ